MDCSTFVCAVCSCVYLLGTVRVTACVHGSRPARVDTLQCFHAVPRPQNCESVMVTVRFFQIRFFVYLCVEVLNRHINVHQQHDQLVRLNARTRRYFTSMSVARKVTNKEVLVIGELDGIHGDSVDFETTSFALVAQHCFVLHDEAKDPPAMLFFFGVWCREWW